MNYLKDPLVHFIGYVLVGIITFGHAWHQVPDTEQHSFAGQEYTVHNREGTKATNALVASIAWPLYWSVRAWQ